MTDVILTADECIALERIVFYAEGLLLHRDMIDHPYKLRMQELIAQYEQAKQRANKERQERINALQRNNT